MRHPSGSGLEDFDGALDHPARGGDEIDVGFVGAVLDLLKPEVEKTVKGLDLKKFDTDPIGGQHFGKITSVMSSAYKRHGYILERAILEALKQCPHFEVWHDPIFQVPQTVDHIVAGSFDDPTKLSATDYPYSPGERTLQVDALVFDKNKGTMSAYEVKRGAGLHDTGKRRSMMRDTLCIQILLKSYAKRDAVTRRTARSVISFSTTANVQSQNHLPSPEPKWTSISDFPFMRPWKR